MATTTAHYHLIKPESADRVAIGNINDNSDTIDGNLFKANERADQLADDYNPSSTYNVGDYVRRENYIYKCNTASTTGTWDVTKWDRVKITEELGGGGGGSSTFAGLNDVNVTGVQNGDIARYNSTTQKWTDSSDLTDLELTVSQLQASVLAITDGHTILDSNGTAMAKEDDLQFASGCVEDDPVNGKTVYIEMIRISQANYTTLKNNGQLKPGAKYFIYDSQPVAVNAYNLPYSASQSTGQKIDEMLSFSSSDFVAKTGVTIGSLNSIYKSGRFAYINLVLIINANLANGAELVDLNSNSGMSFMIGFLLYARNDDKGCELLQTRADGINTYFALASGTVLRIGAIVATQ